MVENDLSDDIIDYLNSDSGIRDVIINRYVTIAKAAKKGMVECKKDKCPNYKRRDNDGYGWREVGCGIGGSNRPLREHEICPYTHVSPFKYDPFKIKKDPELKGERMEIIYKCMKEALVDTMPFGREIKKAIDEVYEDWDNDNI